MTPHRHPIHPSWCLRLSRRGHGESFAERQYITQRPNTSSIHLTSDQLFIIFKIATIESDVTDKITSEVALFGTIMQQNVIENEFNREYAPMDII